MRTNTLCQRPNYTLSRRIPFLTRSIDIFKWMRTSMSVWITSSTTVKGILPRSLLLMFMLSWVLRNFHCDVVFTLGQKVLSRRSPLNFSQMPQRVRISMRRLRCICRIWEFKSILFISQIRRDLRNSGDGGVGAREISLRLNPMRRVRCSARHSIFVCNGSIAPVRRYGFYVHICLMVRRSLHP